MALTKKQYEEIRKELDDCVRPLIFFHDDPDGLASFLLLYRYKKEGKGICVKSTPRVDTSFLKHVKEYSPDKIFIVDLAIVDQDFIDGANTKIVWIDHHEPLERHGVSYYNPRISKKEDNLPASYLCYRVVNQDLWIAMVGCIGDWFLPDFTPEFVKEYGDLLDKDVKRPEDALFANRIGELCNVFSFILKGKTSDTYKVIKILTRINDPEEIMSQTTSQGKFVYKKYKKISERHEALLENIRESNKGKDPVIYIYKNERISFTKDISNRTLYDNPDKTIIIGREKDDDVKMSIRSSHLNVPPMLAEALKDVAGYGGGHEHACGCCVKTRDFDTFVKNFKEQIKLAKAKQKK